MKANRKFIEGEEEGVSAVIGVILMVAITVAIAATVYVYVSGMIGGTPDKTPEIQFIKDETNDRLTVAKTDGEIQWYDLSIRSTATGYCEINADAADTGSLGLTANTLTAFAAAALTTNADVDASDFIDIEVAASGGETDVTITVVHADTNTVLGDYTFQTIAEA